MVNQLELEIERKMEPDRNSQKGGRSFYFFDLDDNVFILATPIFIFHKVTGAELALSSREWALSQHEIGHQGIYQDYFVDPSDGGSFRRFRDVVNSDLQPFCEDLILSIRNSDVWKGPSWTTFYHATFNQRPTSIITARGHSPDTIKDGMEMFVKEGHLPMAPNYLSIYPISHGPTQTNLKMSEEILSVPELKMRAILKSVEKAMQVYGVNPHHRFGMSDDDPKNLELIFEAMRRLKNIYPENSFFVIQTLDSSYVKQEVFLNRIETKTYDEKSQLTLF